MKKSEFGPNATYIFSTVDGSGAQLTTVPVGWANAIEIQSSNNVNVVRSDLEIIGLTTLAIPVVAENDFTYNSQTFTGRWQFPAPLSLDMYLIRLSESSTGNFALAFALDGEWNNPSGTIVGMQAGVSVFPSCNGAPGGDLLFVFTNTPGDADLTNSIS